MGAGKDGSGRWLPGENGKAEGRQDQDFRGNHKTEKAGKGILKQERRFHGSAPSAFYHFMGWIIQIAQKTKENY